jgi:SAM-dependent methyltransferase
VSPREGKTATDEHWNQRAASVADDAEVNLMDIFQRNLEYDHVCKHLAPDMSVLEVGCGNGYSTARFRKLVRHVDAMDYSEKMIQRARESVGETNNSFIVDDIREPRHLRGPYDAVICVRVLINLADLAEQRLAFRNMAAATRTGGLLLLAEGFRDGFAGLSELRLRLGLPPVEPAEINFYSSFSDLADLFDGVFDVESTFHLGCYDFLTRIVYPMIIGADKVRHNTVFSERCEDIARQFNPDQFEPLSRMKGVVLRKRVGVS